PTVSVLIRPTPPPTILPYTTLFRSRPVTGTETLSLQGLPVDELVISTETQAQLRDMAGNAMTVTVVGAVSLALLLAISKTAPGRDRKSTRLNSSHVASSYAVFCLKK